MATSKSVTIAQTAAGEAVVINNKRDGIKKYSLFFGGLIFAAILEGVQQLWPGMTPFIAVLIGALQKLGILGGAMALTSPFDKRGVVIHGDGTITGDKIGVPNPPSAPGTLGGGMGMSIFAFAFLGFFCMLGLTACVGTPGARPQSCPTTLSQPVPLVPVATMTRTAPAPVVTTTGLKNPGALPGENFSVASGGSCRTVQSVDGWVTICEQPNDGDVFDARRQNEARRTALAEYPNLLGRP